MPYILGKTRTQQQNLIPMRDLILQFFTRYDRSKFHVTNIQKIMKLFRAYLKFTRTKFKKNPHEQAVSLSIAKPYRYCQHRYRPGKKVKNNRIIFFIREIKQTFEITNQKLKDNFPTIFNKKNISPTDTYNKAFYYFCSPKSILKRW